MLWARSLTEWRAAPGVTFKNTLYYYRAERDFRNLETYRYNAANSRVLRSAALLQRHEQSLVGNRVEGLVESTLAGLPTSWSFGADLSVNKQTRYPTSLPATVDAVDPYDFQPGYFYDIPGMTRGHNPVSYTHLRRRPARRPAAATAFRAWPRRRHRPTAIARSSNRWGPSALLRHSCWNPLLYTSTDSQAIRVPCAPRPLPRPGRPASRRRARRVRAPTAGNDRTGFVHAAPD